MLVFIFQSTRSAGSATFGLDDALHFELISIHALRRERDESLVYACD